MRGIINPLVGFADAFGDYTEFVEYDTGGEYWRFDMLANCWTDTLEERFDVQEQADITGISVRVDRGGNNVLNHPNAVNIMYLGLRSSGEHDEDEVWNAFVREHYGEGLEEEIKEILYPTGQVNAEALCIGHAQFGSGRSGTPGSWRYKNPAANPLSWRLSMRMQWGMMEAGILEDSPMMREWFMAQEGHDLIIAKEKDAYATQLASAETSLAKLQPLKDRLEPGAFELLDWLLTENILHLKAMQELQLAWLYAKRAQHTEGSEESQEFIDQMEHHIANFHALENEYEIGKRPEITWREREHTVPRGAWMNWDRMRERWFPNLRKVANSAPDEEYPSGIGNPQGFPENFPREIPVIKHFQKQAGNDDVSSSQN
jgi:hypothetical protein